MGFEDPAQRSRHRPGRARAARRPGGRSGSAAVGVVAVGPGQAVAVAAVRRTGGPSPAMVQALLSMPRR